METSKRALSWSLSGKIYSLLQDVAQVAAAGLLLYPAFNDSGLCPTRHFICEYDLFIQTCFRESCRKMKVFSDIFFFVFLSLHFVRDLSNYMCRMYQSSSQKNHPVFTSSNHKCQSHWFSCDYRNELQL